MTATLLGRILHADTLLQVIFDFGFVFVGVLIGALWVGNGLPIAVGEVITYALILALTMLAINAWLGFYQRIHTRTVEDSRARAVLSLHLSVPVAYVLFILLPSADANRLLIELSGMAALFGMLTYRVQASHRNTRKIIANHILIFGVGDRKSVV